MDWGTIDQTFEVARNAFSLIGTASIDAWWDRVRGVLGYFVIFLVVYTVLQTLRKLGTIRDVMVEFNKSRGPIWDLRGMIEDLKKTEPVISNLAQTLTAISKQLIEVEGRVETARQQFIQSQVDMLSERSPEPAETSLTSPEQPALNGASAEAVERNWARLQEVWRKNTRRIEYRIDQIADGRKRRAYDRMPRTNYTKIVDKMETAGQISSAAANASRRLNELFNTYRPINKMVPNSVVGPLDVLDKQLDAELVNYTLIVNGDEPPIPTDFPDALLPDLPDTRMPATQLNS